MKYLKYILILFFLFSLGCSSKKTVYLYPKKEVPPKIFLQNLELEMNKQLKELYSNNFEKRVIATNEMELGKKTLNYYAFRIIRYEKVNNNDLLSIAFENPIVYYYNMKNNISNYFNYLKNDKINKFGHSKLYYQKQREIKKQKLIKSFSLKKEIFNSKKNNLNYDYIITIVNDNLNSKKIKLKRTEKLLIYLNNNNNIKIIKTNFSENYFIKKIFKYFYFYFEKNYVIIKTKNKIIKKELKNKETIVEVNNTVFIIERVSK